MPQSTSTSFTPKPKLFTPMPKNMSIPSNLNINNTSVQYDPRRFKPFLRIKKNKRRGGVMMENWEIRVWIIIALILVTLY